MSEMTVKRTPSGWAVSGGESCYLMETKTKREAQAWIDNARVTIAANARGRAEAAERAAAADAARALVFDERTVEFVRLGYAGASLDFRTQVRDVAAFRRCMDAIGGYNRFSGTAVADAIGGMFGELMYVEVGRESSVVLYVYLPFTAQQRAGSREGCVPIPEEEREALKARVVALGEPLGADEIGDRDFQGRPYCVRLWWD